MDYVGGSYTGGVPISITQRQAYKDMYNGKEPPGYLETQGGRTTPPTQLTNIANDPAFSDFYTGLWQTYNAQTAYPTFEIRWEGGNQQ